MNQIKVVLLIIVFFGNYIKCAQQIRYLPVETKLLHVGDDTKLECALKNYNFDNSLINIHWERPLGTIISNGPVLILKNVQLTDSGNYTCKAIQKFNSQLVNEEMIEEVVIESSNPNIPKPEILISGVDSENRVDLTETQFLMLNCKVENWNREKYRVQWLKESTGEYLSTNNILFIKSVVKDKNDGRYRCEIQHKDDESRIFKKHADIFIKKPSITTIIMPTEHLAVNGLIHRKCLPFNLTAGTYVEKYSFRWIDQNGQIVSYNSMLQIPINDDSVAGTYECQYVAEIAQIMYKSKIFISKFSNEPNQSDHYDISIVQYPNKLILNHRLSLRCQVTPSMRNLRYEWFRNGKYYRSGQTLVFPRFTKFDADNYECRVIGTNENNIEIYLTVESDQRLSYISYNKIELLENPGPNIAIRVNEKKELHCEIEGINGLSGDYVEWFFNGQKIENSFYQLYRLDRVNRHLVSILVLLNSQLDNEGRYECRYGVIRKEATVILDIENEMVVINPPEIKVNEGSPVEFHCRIDHFPNVDNRNLSWRFYDEKFEKNYSIENSKWKVTKSKIADHTSFINLDKASLSDSGYVECVSSNGITALSRLIVLESKHKFNITVTPQELRVRKNQLFQFECFGQSDEGIPYGEPKFEFSNGKLITNDTRFIITEVGPSRIKIFAPNGINIEEDLKIMCSVNKQISVATVHVQDTCPINHRQCKNKQCLSIGKFCDGNIDCDDESDEDQTICNSCEPVSTVCQSVNGVPPTRKLVNKNWICDGENDCGNNFDEINCEENTKCNRLYFTCNNNMTIPRGQVCDGSSDCLNDEDEMDCLKPIIIKTSSPQIKGQLGGQIKLQCDATGYPLPTIIWRFNWGCLPDEKRVTITNVMKNCRKVQSTLTINDFQPGDDAIYNCEALSSSNRALSDDFHVTIQ